MNKQEFKGEIIKLIEANIKQDEYINNLYSLGIDIIESEMLMNYETVFDIAVKALIPDEEKRDTFYWYIFEYTSILDGRTPCIENAEMWDKDNNPICYDLDSLIDYLYES